MRITWIVDDGYTNSGTHVTTIPDDEIAEYDTEEAREKFIAEYVDEEFRQNVFWSIVKRES